MRMAMTQHEAIAKRLVEDRAWFRLGRIWETLRYDSTGIVEFIIGFLAFGVRGSFILFGLTSFPPPDVQFLLRKIALTEHRLGLVLVVLGVVQILGLATRSHACRALIATVGMGLCALVALAYVFAEATSYYQAWIGYSIVAVTEFYIMVRQWAEQKRAEKARAYVRERLHLDEREKK